MVTLQLGIPAVVLEREPAPREEGSAITFWPNAFRVLDTLGVAHHVRETHSLVHRSAHHPFPTQAGSPSDFLSCDCSPCRQRTRVPCVAEAVGEAAPMAPSQLESLLRDIWAWAGWRLWTGMNPCCAPSGWRSVSGTCSACVLCGNVACVLRGSAAWGRVEIVDWGGALLRSFGLEECRWHKFSSSAERPCAA